MAAIQVKRQLQTPPQAIEFPERDGKPMGETQTHIKQIINLVTHLERFFRHRNDVVVIGDIMLYYDPITNKKVVSPDVFVAFGIDASYLRCTWKTWEESKAPDVVFEITSKATRKEDTRDKLAAYQSLGVQEYFLYDPLDEYLKPPLQGYRLVEGQYERLEGERLTSQVLGLELERRGQWLGLYDPVRQEWLPTPEQETEARLAAEARAAQEEAARQAEAAARRVAEARAQALEAELARVREELARRGG